MKNRKKQKRFIFIPVDDDSSLNGLSFFFCIDLPLIFPLHTRYSKFNDHHQFTIHSDVYIFFVYEMRESFFLFTHPNVAALFYDFFFQLFGKDFSFFLDRKEMKFFIVNRLTGRTFRSNFKPFSNFFFFRCSFVVGYNFLINR